MKKISIKFLFLTNLLLYSFLSYSTTHLDISCYMQFTKQRLKLNLPEDAVKRSILWHEIQSNPDKYFRMLNLPQATQEKSFQLIEENIMNNSISEIEIAFGHNNTTFHPETSSFTSDKMIKQLSVSFAPRKENQPPYYKAYVMLEPEPKPNLKLVPSPTKKLTENQILKEKEEINSKISILLEKINNNISQTNTVQLHQMTAKLEKIQESASSNVSQAPKAWEIYKTQLKTIEQKIYTISKKQKIKTLDELLIQVSFLEENHIYSVSFPDNKTYFIEFDKKVTSSLNKLSPNQIKIILSKIKKGFIGGTQETGLKILNQNSSTHSKYKSNLVEIKTMGAQTGHIRIGGFIEGNHIKFVRFISESDHSKNTARKHFKKNIHKFSKKK